MKMHDLGDRTFMQPERPAGKKRKPEPYYPSVTVDDAEDMAKLSVGQNVRLHISAEVSEQSMRDSPRSGKKHSTHFNMKSLGLASTPKPGGSLICPECGAKGAGPYCPTCSAKMGKR